MSYQADPRAEELQLLRQCLRGPVEPRHSATIAVAERLYAAGEVFMVKGWIELSAAGRRALRNEDASRSS
jgi:hypothetical protein